MRDYIARYLAAFIWAYRYRRAAVGIVSSLRWAQDFASFTDQANNYHRMMKQMNVIHYESYSDYVLERRQRAIRQGKPLVGVIRDGKKVWI